MSGTTESDLRERGPELRELAAAFEAAKRGEGRLLLVEGAAGSGKSALAAAAIERGTGLGLRALRARGGELEREFAFGAIRQLFEPVLAAAGSTERERLLGGAAQAAEWVLATSTDEVADRSAAGFAALRGIYWLASNLADAAPVLLVVDDAHWVDASSLRALSFLARRIADLPIALLVTLRLDEPGASIELLDELKLEPTALRLELGPLSARSTAEIVRDRMPAASAEACTAFHAATAGNPLYLQELLRTVGADGLIGGVEPATAVREASLPSLGDRVVRRIARLAPSAPSLTSAMAVLGDGGRLSIAAQLAGMDEPQAGEIAKRLRRLEVLAAEDPFEFVHPLVRRSVYDVLTVVERDAIHSAAANLLRDAGAPPEAIAAQLANVRPRGSATSAAIFLEAAEQAQARAAPDEALRWLRRALDEAATDPPAAVILSQLGLAEVAIRDPVSIAHLQRALELTEDPGLRVRVSVALAEILINVGRWDAGKAVINAALEESWDHDPVLAVEVAAVQAGAMAYDPSLIGEFDRERTHFERLAAGDGWAAHALAALLAAVSASRGESTETVMTWVERALEGGRLIEGRDAGAWASAQLLSALMAIDAYERTLMVSELVNTEARRCGSLVGLMTAVGYRGWVTARRGDLAAAEAELRTAIDIVFQAGMPMLLVGGLFFLTDAILERPSLDDVAGLVESTELDPVFLTTWSGAMLLDVRGRLRLVRRERASAIEDLRASGTTATALRIAPTASSWRSALALALPPEQREEAIGLVAEELELARANGLARPQAIALRAAGMLDATGAGIDQLRESVSLLEASEDRLQHARSCVELGAALRRRHRRAEAREQLATGIRLARRCGAERLEARAGDELRAAGGRVRRPASTGVDALTASELRVAALAAERRTSPEIAQELYVSLKTVETHLSHVYAKLGLAGQGSRSRLAKALTEGRLDP
jgi:DNA-binding CsgD family transcriptional regulator